MWPRPENRFLKAVVELRWHVEDIAHGLLGSKCNMTGESSILIKHEHIPSKNKDHQAGSNQPKVPPKLLWLTITLRHNHAMLKCYNARGMLCFGHLVFYYQQSTVVPGLPCRLQIRSRGRAPQCRRRGLKGTRLSVVEFKASSLGFRAQRLGPTLQDLGSK